MVRTATRFPPGERTTFSGQVVDTQGVRQGPLGLGKIGRVQQSPFHRQSLQSQGHRAGRVALLQRRRGVFRQRVGALGPLHLPKSHKGRPAAGQEGHGQGRRGQRDPPAAAPGAGVVFVEMLQVVEHLGGGLIAQLRLRRHGFCHNGGHRRRTGPRWDGRHILGAPGRTLAGDEDVAGGAQTI